ncbi:MAG: ketose-bisphosphate aldolase [Candidatus Omnitrophota bacterium]
MPLVPMRVVLEASLGAYQKGRPFAVGAYNVNNMEQMQGIMRAARETLSPVIIQASRGALKYAEMNYIEHIMLAAIELNPDIPIVMHLDHGNNLDTVKKAIALGFSSVMIDGSLEEDGKTASSYEYNVRVTGEVVKYAHSFGVTVEGELGTLGGIEDGVGSGKIHLTDPLQAMDFVKKTKVDALAIAIGTSHGAYKFKTEPKLAFDIIEKTRELLPDTFLVSHGSSSVPADLIEAINRYGGNMQHTMGVPLESLRRAINLGINKINVDTDTRLAVTAAIRKFFVENPEKFDPREYLGPARDAIYEIVKKRMTEFNTAGHSRDVIIRTLDGMKKLYL